MPEGRVAPESPRAPLRRWPLGAAAAMTTTVLFCLATSRDPGWRTHPVYWIALVAAVVGAAATVLWAWRTPSDRSTSRRHRRVARLTLVLVTVLAVGGLVWLRPVGAGKVAFNALTDGSGVSVRSTPLVVRMDPDQPKHTGLVFYPAVGTDPRAYASLLRPIAEAGYVVLIITLPSNVTAPAASAAGVVVGDRRDGTERWVVGGDADGGTMAAEFATIDKAELAGLLLYGAAPAQSLADRTSLDVVALYGTVDGPTPPELARTKANLPAAARLVEVEGGTRGDFADRGAPTGDGRTRTQRHNAQSQIVAATIAQLDRVEAE